MKNVSKIENEILSIESKLNDIKKDIMIQKNQEMFKSYIIDLISNKDVVIIKNKYTKGFSFKNKSFNHNNLLNYYPNEKKCYILYSTMWKRILNKFNYDNKEIKRLLELSLSEYFDYNISVWVTSYRSSKGIENVIENLKK
jgi:hypothetical protein